VQKWTSARGSARVMATVALVIICGYSERERGETAQGWV
jgi:hypothetical protein